MARIQFGVIGINHGHINGMVSLLQRGGGQFKSFFAREPDLAEAFAQKFPDAHQARDEREILEDPDIHLVASAAIPSERAALGIQVMRHGKDYLSDKAGFVNLEDLESARQVQQETRRIYSICYSERLENPATVRAGELVKAGAIGRVMQTIGLGPHRLGEASRPEWFWNRAQTGGILIDIGSHQVEQFLHFTGSKQAEVVSSQVANYEYRHHEGFDDWGDMTLRGDGADGRGATGYARVDWFTPQGLNSWGYGQVLIQGTNGFIEVRKNADLAGREGGNHLFLVDKEGVRYINCSDVVPPFGQQLVDDVLNRTQTAMDQEHCFYASELAVKAQLAATRPDKSFS